MTLQKIPTSPSHGTYRFTFTWQMGGFAVNTKLGSKESPGRDLNAITKEGDWKARWPQSLSLAGHGHKPGSAHSCLHTCCQLQGRREEGRQAGRCGEETWRFEHHTHTLPNCHALAEVTMKLALELAPPYFRSKHVCLKVPSKAPCLWMTGLSNSDRREENRIQTKSKIACL